MHATRHEQNARDNARQKARYLRTDCAQWRAIRKGQLQRFPMCGCGQPANEVDHIEGDTSKNMIGVDLQSMCKRCHSTKTADDLHVQRTGRHLPTKGCDVDGYPLAPDHWWLGERKSLERLAPQSDCPPSRAAPRIGRG